MKREKTLEELQRKVLAFRDARNWKQFHHPKDCSMALVLEANEVLEHFLWKNDTEIAVHIANRKEDIADELSDTLYWLLLISHDLDINLSDAFIKKLKKTEKKYPINKAKNSHKKYTEY